MLKSFVTSLAVLGCLVGFASAQAPRADGVARPVQERAGATNDQQVAAFLFNCNRNEVELAKFAKERAKSDDVKEFAANMIKDHQEACDKLQKLAGPWIPADVATGDRSATEAARPANAPAAQFNWATIHRQIADQHLASIKDELKDLKGTEFDKAYMGCQIGAHVKMRDELKVLSNYVSTDMRQQLEDCSKSTEDHLKEARKIMEEQKDKKDSE